MRNRPDDPWLTYLWERIKPGSTVATLADNRVSFITFNYDRSIEEFFITVLKSAFRLRTKEEARQLMDRAFRIVHLHGAISEDDVPFGRDYDEVSSSGILTQKAAAGIRLINEATGPDPERLSDAHSLLRSAELVCFLGFGFHKPNTERLQLATLKEEVIPIVGSVFGMGTAEIQAANRWVGRKWRAGQAGQRCEEFLRQNVELY